MEIIIGKTKQVLPNISYAYYRTPAGVLKLSFTDHVLFNAIFIEDAEISNEHTFIQSADVKAILLSGTAFQIKVWQAAMNIKESINYQDLAIAIGHPKAHRAVANALSQNRIAYFVPCHKVIQKNGSLGGYQWGIKRKKTLLLI